MNFQKIYIKDDGAFANFVADWAANLNIEVEPYDVKMDEHTADGLLLINANQDIDRDSDELHSLFDIKHIPTQKIDVNGTLQVAISSVDLWMKSNKCKNVLVVGSDKLVENDNLNRFFERFGAINA